MVAAKLSAIHRAVQGESLQSVAEKYRLSSWRALAFAPGNELVREYDAEQPLPASTALRIPPRTRDLLKERVHLLHSIRASMDRHFAVQLTLFARNINVHSLPDDLGRVPVVRAFVGELQACVADAVETAREACQPLARINSGLALTHLHNHSDLQRYRSGDSSVVGFYWLLRPPLVEHWAGMWEVELWVRQWRGCDRAKAVRSASTYLNVVRSKVLQQVDLRLRETLLVIDRLDRERSISEGSERARET